MTSIAQNGCPPEEPYQDCDTQTLEEAVYEQINRFRNRANEMEANLLRLAPAVRRLTRAQAKAVNIYI